MKNPLSVVVVCRFVGGGGGDVKFGEVQKSDLSAAGGDFFRANTR